MASTCGAIQVNVERLKAYRNNLVLYPRNSKKVQMGEIKASDAMAVDQLQGAVMPIVRPQPTLEFTTITDDMKVRVARGRWRVGASAPRVGVA